MKKAILFSSMMLLLISPMFASYYENSFDDFGSRMNAIRDGMQIYFVASVILNLVFLVVFFVLASNIGSIKRLLQGQQTGAKYIDAFTLGELQEFKGNKEKALDHYMDSYFFITRFKPQFKNQQIDKEKHLSQITAKIISLGGVIK
jgi:hypothetical protein